MEYWDDKKEYPKVGRPVVADLAEKENELLLSDLRITNFSAPMDFDGKRIL
jgi:uncharacterized protein YbaA (DUF1428 family)